MCMSGWLFFILKWVNPLECMSSCTFIDRPQTRKKNLRLTRESTNQWLHETGETHHPFILQYTTIIWEKSKLELPVYLDISFRVILHRRKKDSGNLSNVFFSSVLLTKPFETLLGWQPSLAIAELRALSGPTP